MRPTLSRRLALTLSLAVMAVLAVALPAGASASARALYASGHDFDVGRFAKFGGNTVVDPGFGRMPTEGFDGCEDAQWAASLARTDFDVLIVGEDAGHQCALSSDTLASIASYVSSGHRVIVTSRHGENGTILNEVFGFNTELADVDEDENLTGTLLPGAGAAFAGGPATLKSPSETDLLSSTPGTTIYSGPEGTWVFRANYGAGTVTYLGWDLCGEAEGGCGNTPGVEDDWYRVLDNAVQADNAFTIAGIRRNKKKGNATITINLPNPGELTGTGNKAKVASAGGAVISKTVGKGQAKLVVKAKGKKKKKLNRKGKVKLNIAITYTPTGGRANTQSTKVKLKKKLNKKR
jgi:hypothetical protein